MHGTHNVKKTHTQRQISSGYYILFLRKCTYAALADLSLQAD